MPVQKITGYRVTWCADGKKKRKDIRGLTAKSKNKAEVFASAFPDAVIEKYDDGYEVRYDTYNAANVRKQHRQRFDLKRDADSFDAAQKVSGKEESKITVKEYLEAWLLHVKQHRKPSTYADYKYKVDHYILPNIDGRTKLARVKRTHIQAAINKMSDKTDSTLRAVVRILHAAFSQAVADEVIVTNPVKKIECSGKPKREIATLNAAQVEFLLAALDGNDFFMPAFLAASLGMSKAEVSGLRWPRIDLDAGTLAIESIRQHIYQVGINEGSPKTKKRRRTIQLPEFIVEELRREKRRQLTNLVAAGSLYQRSDYVCRKTMGDLLHPSAYHNCLSAALKRAGLPHTTFHGLRHSCASVLIARCVPITFISELLGHANVYITQSTYAHSLPEGKQVVADALEKAYGKK